MNIIIVIVLASILLIIQTNPTIYSTLTITKYDPLSFQLSFSQPIQIPTFQILVDNNNLNYIILNNSTIQSKYQIQVTSDYQSIDIFNTQTFSLMFNYPLDIQNGQLYIGNYVLEPQKISIYITISVWPSYFVFASLLISSMFGIFGMAVFDFIQVYLLTELEFRNNTSVVDTFTNNMQTTLYIKRLFLPNLIVVAFFVFGILIKFFSIFITNNFIKKRLVKFCSYNIFLTIWTITLPSIIYKAFQFINDMIQKNIQLPPKQFAVGIFLTYLNFINFLTYFYVLYFVLNPKIKQEETSFRNYLISQQFQLYDKFHRGLHLRDWVKRNTALFIALRKLIILILFFSVDSIAPYVLAFQLAGAFYIFTVRPYKEWFYTNVTIVFFMIWFFFYIVVLEGFFYYDVSTILETRYSLTKFLLSKSTIFYTICLLGIIASYAESILIFKSLRYQYKQQSEVKNNSQSIVANRGRLYTQTTQRNAIDMKQSLIFESGSTPSPRRKKRQLSSEHSSSKAKLSLFEIEMQQISSPPRKRAASNRFNKKWKDKSLLQQIATN